MRKRSDAGFTLILGMLSLLFIIPMIGLAVDVGFLYISKSKLQAAVDGAALAAARSLNIGSSTASQATAAQNNAVNWFYANFPSNFFGSSGTVMTASNVTVADDPNNAHLRNVQVVATTNVSTFFMKWFGFNATTIGSLGKASRRDVVIMMVLDRSGSMCNGGSTPCVKGSSTPCNSMISAAKLFTGQFAENRDSIGLITFSDSVYVHTKPILTFQTTLGYSNDQGSGTGAIDTIQCQGGTGTAEALSMAYQLLYQMNEPGALNIVFLETDGLPNTLTMNFYDSVNNVVGLKTTSTCQDTGGHTGSNFHTSEIPSWTGGLNMAASPFLTSTGYYSNIPAGMVAAMASDDPGAGSNMDPMLQYWTTSPSTSTQWLTTSNSGARGCNFLTTNFSTNPPDINWFPATDVFGNSLNPLSAYKNVNPDSQGHIKQIGWTNYHNAVLNATDNAAYVARSNATIGAYFFVVGLGGNGAPLDPVLLQRIANDPNGDTFNGTPAYQACASETGCVTYSSQPQGTFIYSTDSSTLAEAFLRISSQVLRISK